MELTNKDVNIINIKKQHQDSQSQYQQQAASHTPSNMLVTENQRVNRFSSDVQGEGQVQIEEEQKELEENAQLQNYNNLSKQQSKFQMQQNKYYSKLKNEQVLPQMNNLQMLDNSSYISKNRQITYIDKNYQEKQINNRQLYKRNQNRVSEEQLKSIIIYQQSTSNLPQGKQQTTQSDQKIQQLASFETNKKVTAPSIDAIKISKNYSKNDKELINQQPQQNSSIEHLDQLQLCKKTACKKQLHVIGDLASCYKYYFVRGYFRNKQPSCWDKFSYKMVGTYHKHMKIDRLRHLMKHYLQVINPESFLKRIWDFLIVGLILVNIYYIPIQLVLYHNVTFSVNSVFSVFVNELPLSLFILELLLNFNTAYIKKGVLIRERNRIAKHYLRTGFFWDLLVIASFTAAIIYKSQITYLIKIVLYLRINKISYIMTTLRENLNLRGHSLAIYKLINLFLLIVFAANILGCIFIYLAVYEQPRGDSNWMSNQGLDALHSESSDIYAVGYYFAIVTMVTIGYGDIYPVNTRERFVVTIIALITCGIYAYALTHIGEIFKNMNQNGDEFREQMAALTEHMKNRNISFNLQQQAKKYFKYQQAYKIQESNKVDEMLQQLPQVLQKKIQKQSYCKFLNKCQVFKDFSDNFLNKLAQNMTTKRYGPEEVIFKQYQHVDSLVFLVMGKIVLSQKVGQEKHIVGYKKKGQPIAFYNFFSDGLVNSTAETSNAVKLATITRNKFLEILNLFPIDKERYYKTKFLIKFSGSVRHLDLSCLSCGNQMHYNINDCPYINYIPSKNKLISQHRTLEKQLQTRDSDYKRWQTKFNSALSSIKEVQDAAAEQIIFDLNIDNKDELATRLMNIERGQVMDSEYSEDVISENISADSSQQQVRTTDQQNNTALNRNAISINDKYLQHNEQKRLNYLNPKLSKTQHQFVPERNETIITPDNAEDIEFTPDRYSNISQKLISKNEVVRAQDFKRVQQQQYSYQMQDHKVQKKEEESAETLLPFLNQLSFKNMDSITLPNGEQYQILTQFYPVSERSKEQGSESTQLQMLLLTRVKPLNVINDINYSELQPSYEKIQNFQEFFPIYNVDQVLKQVSSLQNQQQKIENGLDQEERRSRFMFQRRQLDVEQSHILKQDFDQAQNKTTFQLYSYSIPKTGATTINSANKNFVAGFNQDRGVLGCQTEQQILKQSIERKD